jgi:hypothetical protein
VAVWFLYNYYQAKLQNNKLNLSSFNLAIFLKTLLSRFDVKVGILLTYGQQLHDDIISLRGEG